jgi:hypothetical protein
MLVAENLDAVTTQVRDEGLSHLGHVRGDDANLGDPTLREHVKDGQRRRRGRHPGSRRHCTRLAPQSSLVGEEASGGTPPRDDVRVDHPCLGRDSSERGRIPQTDCRSDGRVGITDEGCRIYRLVARRHPEDEGLCAELAGETADVAVDQTEHREEVGDADGVAAHEFAS